MNRKIHIYGLLLFLFIPLVLFLFLRFPFGIPVSFTIAIFTIIAHRWIARPFFLRNRDKRCFWCGKTRNPRTELRVGSINIQACTSGCSEKLQRFFGFCWKHRLWIGAGIFLPLLWYIATNLLVSFVAFQFPIEWNRFIFRFFIACTVVTISLAYGTSPPVQNPEFAFPIHNLFLLGTKNTLLVFRYVGIWWILAGLYFLYSRLSG